MSESETCPVCKTGKLRPEEGHDIHAEAEDVRQTASPIDLVCDNASCRHRQQK